MMKPVLNTHSNPAPEDLQQAFQLFNQVSEQLTGAYMELQKQVEQLTHELAVANGELRLQLEQKENLSRRLQRLLTALPGGVVVLDASGLISESNPAAAALLGEPLLGLPWLSVQGRALKSMPTPGEWLTQDGSRRVAISASRLEEGGDEILLIQDVTEAYLMQDQLQRHKRLSAMGEMVAGLAHQLRTPLAAALLYTTHLRGELSVEDRERFADKALARLHSLEHLIKDMLIFVRGGKVVQERIGVQGLLSEVQQVMEPQMARHRLRLEVIDAAPGSTLLGSREALAGALLNLLANAMQASNPGARVTLDAHRVEPGWIEFGVRDTGKGVPQAVQERLFEPFFTTRTEGTGLGLAIVREVAQMHGGWVSLQSAEGEGSTFRLRLPLADDALS